MKWKLFVAVLLLSIGNGIAQDSEAKQSVFENLFTVEDAVYQYTQLSAGFAGSQPMIGAQYKRVRHQNVFYFSVTSGFSAAAHWTRLNGQNMLQSNFEVHTRSYPYTLTCRLGLGLDVQTNFRDQNYVSFYPSVGYDLGFVEISYAYLVNRKNDEALANHRLKLAIGLCVKKKKGWS